MVTWVWMEAGGACGYYYCEGRECQRATSKGLAAYREADTGGVERQLKGVFPRQEQQLPAQPSAPHVSSVKPLANLCLWITPGHTIPQPEAYRGRYPRP